LTLQIYNEFLNLQHPTQTFLVISGFSFATWTNYIKKPIFFDDIMLCAIMTVMAIEYILLF
jgi:hypothetical protein